jgi:hypothetical protein
VRYGSMEKGQQTLILNMIGIRHDPNAGIG